MAIEKTVRRADVARFAATVSAGIALLAIVFAAPVRAQKSAARATTAGATPNAGTASSSFGSAPPGVQLINADSNPTLRIPVNHICENPRGGMFIRMSGSYGWLEISRTTIRYFAAHSGRFGKEDIGFENDRSEVTGLQMMTSSAGFIRNLAVNFQIHKTVHYFSYSPPEHWGSHDKNVLRADDIYSPIIQRALRNLDGVLVDFGLKQAAPPPPAAVQPAVAHETTTPPPATPPTIVLLAPAGARENGTVDATESPLTIRGLAMDSSGLPTVSINGVPAALRAKDAHTTEFWSDPLPLQAGNHAVQITASSPAQVTATLAFMIQYTPKTAPVNPKALDKADIISLLVGGVPADRVAQIVKDRGTKFIPTTDDLNVIRAAGGTDAVLEAIQKAAPHP